MGACNPSSHNHRTRRILARRIRLLRNSRHWSQEVLAEFADLNRTYIGALERAEGNPCLDNIEKIADAFGVPVHRLLDEGFENFFDGGANRVEEPRARYFHDVFAWDCYTGWQV